MQSVLGHQAGRPAVRDMTNTGDATMNIEHQPGFHLYPCHLQHVVHSEHALQTHMQRHNQCTVKVYFTHFEKIWFVHVQSLYCAPPPLTTCCYHHWKPLARGVRAGGGGGGRGVVKARQVIPLQARQDWNSDLPAGAAHCSENMFSAMWKQCTGGQCRLVEDGAVHVV